MKLEVFTLCDAATNYNGKLNILGTFDTIFSNTVPIIYPQCSVAVRLRFFRIEEGDHQVTINITDTNKKSVLQPLIASVKINFSKTGPESLATNLILNIHGLKLDKFGDYIISLAVDGRHESTLPLLLKEVPKTLKECPDPSNYN